MTSFTVINSVSRIRFGGWEVLGRGLKSMECRSWGGHSEGSPQTLQLSSRRPDLLEGWFGARCGLPHPGGKRGGRRWGGFFSQLPSCSTACGASAEAVSSLCHDGASGCPAALLGHHACPGPCVSRPQAGLEAQDPGWGWPWVDVRGCRAGGSRTSGTCPDSSCPGIRVVGAAQ